MKTLNQIQEEELKKFDEGCNTNNISDPPSDTKWIKQFLLSAMEASAKGAIREVIEAIESTEIKATCPRSDVDLIKEVEILNEVIKKNIMPEIISQLKQRWLGEKV